MAEPVVPTQGKPHMPDWVRTLQMRHIIAGWVVLILAGLIIGVAAEARGWKLAMEMAANLIPDLFVAGLAFIVAEAVFGFRERQEHREEEQRTVKEQWAQEQRQVIEVQRKAYSVLIREMQDNVLQLERIVSIMQSGSLPELDTVLGVENWKLLVQSPLMTRLAGELVWTLQIAYYEPQARLERLLWHRRYHFTSAEEIAAKFLPDFEEDLIATKSAITMLQQYASQE